MAPRYSKSGYDITPLSRDQVAELAAKLDPEAYRITQKAGTEPAFCGNLLDNHKDGVYVCVVCGLPLFSSEHKFNSGTGWPSFYRAVRPGARRQQGGHARCGMVRTEIDCARCGAHLGPRVRRRPEADRGAPLPQLGRAEVLREGRGAAARSQPVNAGGGRRRPRPRTSRAAASGASSTTSSRARRDRRGQRLHAGARRPPDLQAGLHGHDRPRRDGQGGVRPGAHHLPPAAGGVLHDARSDAAQPPGAGLGDAVPLGDLVHERRAEARGRGVHQGAAGRATDSAAGRSSPRWSRPRRSGPPRTTTRTTSPRPAAACHVKNPW